MDSSAWIAIYLPLFIVLFIVIPQRREMENAFVNQIKDMEGFEMKNELLNSYVGKECKISTGSFGTNLTGKIIEVNENWLVVETKKGQELVNSFFVQSIKMK